MLNKKNVLLFIDWFLPGTASGGPVRSLVNMMVQMEEVTNFYVITRNTDYCSITPYENINVNQWNQLFPNVKVFYLSEDNIKLKTYNTLIKNTPFDVAYVNGIYSFKFSILPLIALKKFNKQCIVGARGMVNPQAFSVKGFKKRIFLQLATITGLYRNIIFHATNEDEKSYIKKEIDKNSKVIVAPNFPRKIQASANIKRVKKPGEIKFVSLARISKEKGTLFMLKLFSGLNAGQIILDLYGPVYDEDYWRKCQNEIKGLPENIKVEYKGILKSEQVPTTLENYHFFLMPSEGENFGHSILEALSLGLPVIISNLTPWKNLNKKKVGWDIPLQNTDEFHNVLIEATNMDQKNYDIWSQSAFEYAKKFINDPAILAANKKLFFHQ